VERSTERAVFEGELGTHYLALKNERVFVASLVVKTGIVVSNPGPRSSL
jgi:hypothetical protein